MNRFVQRRVAGAIAMATLVGMPLIAQEGSEDKTPAGPRAVLVRPIHELGSLDYGVIVHDEFEIRNEGNAPLDLFDVVSNCGCTILEYDETIAPGRTGTVRVSLDTESQSGAFAVNMRVSTSDPSHPRLALTLKAELRYRVMTQPGYARYVTHIGSAEGSLITQTLWAADGADLRIVGVESPYPFVEASYRKATAEERLPNVDAEQWKVETRLLPTAPVGPLNGLLLVQLDHPRQKLVKVPVFGFVKPLVSVSPEIIDFGPIRLEGEIRGSFQIENSAPEPLELIAVETTVPGIEVRLMPDAGKPGKLFYVSVTIGPGVARGPFEGSITIRTNSTESPLIEVPLRGEIQ